jgi:HSP20 family protein
MSDTLQPREKQELSEESTRPGFVFRPDIDILENRDGYVIYADLPGADDKSVDVRLDRGTLTLDARLATMPDSSWTPLHAEYRFGSYHREFRISEDIDPAGVAAKMQNGVLELLLPKSAERRPRAIQVQAG